MASPTQWAWVWVNSGSLWWTGRPGVLWFIGSQGVGRNWATKLNWTDWYFWNNAMVVNLLLTRACNDRTIYLVIHGKVLAKPSPKIQRVLWIPPDDCFIRPIMLTFYHSSWFSVINIRLRVIIKKKLELYLCKCIFYSHFLIHEWGKKSKRMPSADVGVGATSSFLFPSSLSLCSFGVKAFVIQWYY